MDDLTPGQLRTLRAREQRTKNKLDRMAAELRAAGYLVVAPEHAIQTEREVYAGRTALTGTPRG